MGLFDFVAGGPRGYTYEDMVRRRALADALTDKALGSAPKTIGEALTMAGQTFGSVLADRRVAKDDAKRAAVGDAAFNAEIEKMGYESPLVSALADPPVALAEPPPAAYGITPGASTTFPASLIETESGGNWSALNSEGYGGRLQFGKDRLADAARAGVIPAGITGADFSRLPPEAQQRVEQWHFADIDRQAEQKGLTRYVGQTVGGIPITQDGIRAMAHLGGIGGAAKFLNSGGRVNPADSNGTSLADYAARHGGQMTAQPTAAQPTAYTPLNIPPAPQVNVSLIRALNNPYMSPEQRQVLATIYQQQQANQITPYQQAQLALQQQQMAMQGQITPYQAATLEQAQAQQAWEREKYAQDQAAAAAQAERDAAADAMTPGIREYEYAMARGDTNLGFDEWKLSQTKAGAPQINMGGGNSDLLKKLSENEGTQWGLALETGTRASVVTQDLDLLDELVQLAPTGPLQGRLAQAFPGFSSSADALRSVVSRVAPSLREPGSGSTSDVEYDGMLKSLPSLINKPEANQAIIGMLRAKASIQMERAATVAAFQNGEIDERTARTRMQDLAKQSIMTPELKALLGETVSGGTAEPEPSSAAQTLGDSFASKLTAPAQVTNDAEYDALPSGASFVDPDGNLRVKP